jgi:hypothetical protein
MRTLCVELLLTRTSLLFICAFLLRGSGHAGETVKGDVRERCIHVYVASSVDSPLP